MSNKVTGVVYHIGQEEVISSKFKKRLIVVETEDEKYPQKIAIEFQQDKTDDLDTANIGDTVEVQFNLRGREWIAPDGIPKFFNTLVGWNLLVQSQDNFSNMTQDILDNPAPTANQENKVIEAHQKTLLNNNGEAPKDDLPF